MEDRGQITERLLRRAIKCVYIICNKQKEGVEYEGGRKGRAQRCDNATNRHWVEHGSFI